jgi:hypothetical protein
MKKLSTICTVMFVIGMMASSGFAQECERDEQCTIEPLLMCLAGNCVECILDDDCGENEMCDDAHNCVFGGPTVQLDIKPGSCPSPLNVRSRGVLPVAILGAGAIDVTSIDPETVLITREGFDGAVPVAPIRYSYDDVGTPSGGAVCDCDDPGEDDLDEDINADGITDLTLKFSVPELVDGLGLDEVDSGGIIRLTIMGESEDGTFMGEDCVKIINKFKWFDDILEKIKKPKKPKNGDQE